MIDKLVAAPKSLFTVASGFEKSPSALSNSTSYNTIPPSAAPPPDHDNTTGVGDDTFNWIEAGELNSVGTAKSVFNS